MIVFYCITGFVGSHPTRISNTIAGTDIFIRSVDCDGNEGKLLECSTFTGDHCNSADVAGVRCEGKFTLFCTHCIIHLYCMLSSSTL